MGVEIKNVPNFFGTFLLQRTATGKRKSKKPKPFVSNELNHLC
jgi:hypothetical protein